MKKKVKRGILMPVTVAVLLLVAVMCIPGYEDLSLMVNRTVGTPIIVIDPGHGGIDGGAASKGGVNEKNINLAMALELRTMLEREGMKVMLTRDRDLTRGVRERKAYIEKVKPDLAVSIHLNSFTADTSVRGAQVFYPAWGEEEGVKKACLAAKLIQVELNREINEKPRTQLSKGDVFLLEDVRVPTVIVECGFLSNPENARKLKDREHQKIICQLVKTGICKYMVRTP